LLNPDPRGRRSNPSFPQTERVLAGKGRVSNLQGTCAEQDFVSWKENQIIVSKPFNPHAASM
jgi:hypothetical protein